MTSSYLAVVKDGKIQVMDNFYIPEKTKLLITPIHPDDNLEDTEDWEYFSLNNLNQCYGEDEAEFWLDLEDFPGAVVISKSCDCEGMKESLVSFPERSSLLTDMQV